MMEALCWCCSSFSFLQRRLGAPLIELGRTPPLDRWKKYHAEGDSDLGVSGGAGCCIGERYSCCKREDEYGQYF